MRFHAPYMEWAKKRPSPRFDLAGSNVSSCTIDDLAGARDALGLSGGNDNGYAPLVDEGFALNPDDVARALTPRTRLVVVTSPHNPTGALADRAALEAIGQLACETGAHVLVDEVYLDAAGPAMQPAVLLGEPFISTSSLTKSYGLSSLRCGWSLSSPAVAERIRRARDVIDGSGSIAGERLATLAFAQLDRLEARSAALLAVNRPLVHAFLRGRAEIEVVLPHNSTVVFPRIRGVQDTSAFAERLLAERGTAIVPGRFFEAAPHFRLGFGGPSEAVLAGLEQLGAALDGLT